MAAPPVARGRPRGTVQRNFFLRDGHEHSKTDNPALAMACPVCGALSGSPCAAANGTALEIPHTARRAAAQRGRP